MSKGAQTNMSKWIEKNPEVSILHNYRKLSKLGEVPPPQGGAHQLVVQSQMGNPENIHTSNVMLPQRVVFRKYTKKDLICINC